MTITEEIRFCVGDRMFGTRKEAERFVLQQKVAVTIADDLMDVYDPYDWLKRSLEGIAWNDGGDGEALQELIASLIPPKGKARLKLVKEGEHA